MAGTTNRRSPWLIWAALFISIGFSYFGAEVLPKWMLEYPRAWTPNFQKSITAAMLWLVDDAAIGPLSFGEVTRGLAWLLEQPMELLERLFAEGFEAGDGSASRQVFPPMPWTAVIAIAAWLSYKVGGRRLAILITLCLLYLVLFGQWESSMITLSSIIIAVPIGVVAGGLLGVAAYRTPIFEKILNPVLDLMQTVPTFAYLVPILFLFGFGPAAAIVATTIYATPPMVRLTLLSLNSVPAETRELGSMVGCTERQMYQKILIPSAQKGLMVGVNQVIMLSLNMVIIASMIGAGGLGYDVLISLRRLDIGSGLEAGIAIVFLAIALDRFSQALANRPDPVHRAETTGVYSSQNVLAAATIAGLLLVTYTLGFFIPAIQTFPESWTITTAPFWAAMVSWININLFDYIEAAKTILLLNVLVPFKAFLLAQPWPWVLFLLTLSGFLLGGLRLGALVAALVLFILLGGIWEKAVITVYLCGISVVIAMLIGVPIGIFATRSKRAYLVVHAVIDTLQTLPTFVFLIPVVMLLRIGDISAIFAVVSYAVVPAIRYTAHGLSGVKQQLIEAGQVSGCTDVQLLRKVRLPMATPEILLGLNQTVMMALSMLVVTALVGTRDLGQEVFIALSRAEPGKGIVAGLGVAAIAIITDRLLTAKANRIKQRLGLE